MKKSLRWSSRLGRVLLISVSLMLVAIPPTVAYAATVQTYAQGTNNVGFIGQTTSPMYADRNFNRVYHKAGTLWALRWCSVGSGCGAWGSGTTNPLLAPGGANIREECQNLQDLSGVQWTCQTTKP